MVRLVKELFNIIFGVIFIFGPLLLSAVLEEPLIALLYIVHIIVIIIRQKHVKEHGYY